MGRIIIAGQNETIRKKYYDDVDLATMGLISCVAVIIKDQKGNASLTHADHRTDLNFITDEITLMDGEYTIDIVQSKTPFNICNKVLTKINELKSSNLCKPDVQPTTRISVDSSVLLRKDKFLVPKLRDLCEISQPNISISENNKLKKR